MKDIQGCRRGICNQCECKEYMAPPQKKDSSAEEPRRLRCEYCNHTPAEHVWLVDLGACNKCGKDNCEKYESDEQNSYTDCGYCGCKASQHEGAEKLRRKVNATNVANPPPVNMRNPLPDQSWTVAPRVDATGCPVQTMQFGLCKNPGCQYPKRVENGTVHDYCSRTCANAYAKNSAMQGSFGGFMQTSYVSTAGQTNPGAVSTQGPVPSLHSRSSAPPLGPAVCSKCKKNAPNKGFSLCANCFAAQKGK